MGASFCDVGSSGQNMTRWSEVQTNGSERHLLSNLRLQAPLTVVLPMHKSHAHRSATPADVFLHFFPGQARRSNPA